MPIKPFIPAKSFDPETIEIMNAAFVAVCADIGLSDRTTRAREVVAERIIELMNGERDPQAIRRVALASLGALKGPS